MNWSLKCCLKIRLKIYSDQTDQSSVYEKNYNIFNHCVAYVYLYALLHYTNNKIRKT